jgi:hypothetical protein
MFEAWWMGDEQVVGSVQTQFELGLNRSQISQTETKRFGLR